METLEGYRTLPFVDPAEVGRNLERLLDERGMSQTELGKKAEIQQEAINRAIKTGKGLSFRRWQKIASTLEIPVENIFGLQRLPADENTLPAL